MKKLIIIVVVLAILAIGVWQASKRIKERRTAAQETEQALRAVEVREVGNETIQEELSLVGNIVAAAEVIVLSEVPGKLVHIAVDEGSKVKKGDVIAKIEDKELKLRVNQAEAAVEAATVALEQAKSLAEVRIRSQIAQAQAGFSSAEAALKQVKDLAEKRTVSQLEQAEAGLAALKANLKKIKNGARTEERRQIEATVQQAKASLDNAKMDLERIENLYASGAISKQTLDATRTGATVAEAQYEAASQQLKLVETGARDEDILAMESQVKQAESALELSKSMTETRSWEQDIEMAQAGYNQAKAGMETAQSLEKARSWEAEITATETGLKQAQAALELSREMLDKATITAPISGIVSQRFLDEGAMAAPAVPLFTIVDMDQVKAVVDITEADISKISSDKTAYVSVESLPGEKLEGQITMISPTVKPMSRTVSVEIVVDNASHKLKPGMFARVSIPVEIRENAVVVGRSAVVEDRISGGKYLFVVGDNNTSSKRKVETGIVESNRIEVLSGVQAGEKVVVSGQHFLKDGDQVRVSKALE
ncbi:efflux RND transporter periplasmic adaptor subunit [Candidatus Poribacteria bacterium]